MAKTKKCKVCKKEFSPTNTLQKVCSLPCALSIAKSDHSRRYSSETKALRRKLRDSDRGYWLKLAQKEFNRFIRMRDKDLPCVSCGRFHQGQWHAGHYRSVGAHPELRFEELNAHRQCQPCNSHKSGDIINYRINLIGRIGEKKVKWLEGPHTPRKYTIDELQELVDLYRGKCRENG